MRAKSIAIIMDGLIILPFLFVASGRHQIQSRDLILAGVFALISISFRYYKRLGFEDRFLLALQLLIFVVVINIFLPYSVSLERCAQSIIFPIEGVYFILFYIILSLIGIYTTFWTQAGFIGIIGNPRVVRRDSLVLLSCIIAITFGIIFFPDFIIGWFIITGILWRSNVYAFQRINKIEPL